MDCYSFAIGFGGLVVAAMTTILAYIERSASLRQKVFEEQVKACRIVLRSLSRFHATVWQFAVAHRSDVGQEAGREELRSLATTAYLHHAVLFSEWALLLPEPVIDECVAYVKVYKSVLKGEESGREAERLVAALGNAVDAARSSLHVEPLSKAVARVVGDLDQSR